MGILTVLNEREDYMEKPRVWGVMDLVKVVSFHLCFRSARGP